MMITGSPRWRTPLETAAGEWWPCRPPVAAGSSCPGRWPMAVRLHERAICLCGAPAAAPPGGGGRGPPLPAPGRSAEGRGGWAGCPALDGGAAGVSLEALGGAQGLPTVPLVPLDAGLTPDFPPTRVAGRRVGPVTAAGAAGPVPGLCAGLAVGAPRRRRLAWSLRHGAR